MAEKLKKPQVILKRQIITKAVVTEKFKGFLTHELGENLKQYKQRLTDLTTQLNSLDTNNPMYEKFNQEKLEAQAYIDSEQAQRKFISDLKLKTLYSQGPVDGFVTVSVGDNLYEKLGGVEIVVEDGIVKKIDMNPSQFDKVTG